MNLLFLIIILPLLGCFCLPFIGAKIAWFRNLLSFLLVFIPLVLGFILLPGIVAGQPLVFFSGFGLGINLVLNADALALFMALVSLFISCIIILYSFDYIKQYDNQNEYYFFVVLFIGSMMGLVFSANLIFIYIFWELTAVCSWRLIGFYRKKEIILRADKSLLITMFGALAMLLGFIMIYQQTGSFDLSAIKGVHLSGLTVSLILLGIFSKSATLPLQTWLPDAGVAPSPITALLHAAVLVKIGVYFFARLFIANSLLLPHLQFWIIAFAAASALISGGAAFMEKDLKRIIAYSTISQLAFIFLGFAVSNAIGIAGALLYILMHGLAKAGLFLCAGIVEHNAKTKNISNLGGLSKTMPFTSLAFLFCSFSIMGIPPFGGFFSKYMVISGAAASGQWMLTLVFMISAVFTVLYLLRAYNAVFMGEIKTLAQEHSNSMVACVVGLAILSLASGLLVNFPLHMVTAIIKQVWI
jgi:NADH:ubiquinone oxidoreductase subunit 5 (subunit L)/multisubunit Na+/H+ antiporter MnhA subunit